MSAVAGIAVILVAEVIFRYQRTGGPRYKPSTSGQTKYSVQLPDELEVKDQRTLPLKSPGNSIG